MKTKKTDNQNEQPSIEELEPRILFSAGLEAIVLDSLMPDSDAVALYQHKDEASLQPTDAVAAESVVASRQELVFIDTNTPDYQTLVDDLLSNNQEDRTIYWVLIDSSKNGIQQISDTLEKYNDLDAVHIISHGSDGNVQLGNNQLGLDSLLANTDAISNWGNAFSAEGDLLFYGCELAASEDGQSLINSLSELTGTDVAASDDLTGSTDLGGDWELEYHTGTIESDVAIGLATQLEYSGLLVNEAPTNILLSQTTQVAITNAGFEADALANGGNQNAVTGWTTTANAGVWDVDAGWYTNGSPEGENVAYIDSTAGGDTLSQTLSETFEANRSYTLSALVGDELPVGGTNASGWEMRLYGGTQLLGSVSNADFDPADGEFVKATLHLDADTLATYAANYGDALRIEFFNIDNTGSVANVHIDDVQLEYTYLNVADQAANGTPVADVASVVDPNSGDTFTYSLTDNAGGRFAIDSNTGIVTVANGALLDYATNSSHNIVIRATDQTGLSYDETFTIQVRPPINSLPATASVNEDSSLVFSNANGNQIKLQSDNPASTPMDVMLSVSNGTLTLSQTTGLTFVTGDGTTDASMRIQGTLADINAALDGMTYTPDANYNGAASLSITSYDDARLLGNYSFDNTGNLGADTGPGTANNGSATGTGPASDPVHGQVAAFNAANGDKIDVSGLYGQPANVTLAAWIDFNGVDPGDVISLGDAVVLRAGDWGAGSDALTGFFYDGSSWNETKITTTLSGAGWHHVAYVFDDVANRQALYLNGIEVASSGFGTSISYTSPAIAGGTLGNSTIGNHADPDEPKFNFDGRIDDARIYDRALSATEIVDIMNAPMDSSTDSVAITVNAVNDAPTDITFDSESSVEKTVNTYGALDQIDPAIAAFDNGGYITVWASNGQDGSGYGIYGQRYNADGTTNGAEFLVTSETTDSETNPSVATFSDGGFVVTWQDQVSGVNSWTEARTYNADGTAATTEFRVSLGLDGANEGYQPAVVTLNANEFVIVWANETASTTYEVAGQIYDRSGATVGSQFSVGSLLSGSGLFGAQTEITRLNDGGFAVAWRTHDGTNLGTRARVMNADGSVRSAEIILNGDNISDISALSNGNFVVTYDTSGALNAAIYDASGILVSPEFKVNTTTSAARYESTVTRSDDGFVVVWESSAGDGSSSAILAQRFDANGNKIDSEVIVNQTTAGNQQKPEVIETATGQVIAVWQSENVDGATTGIASRIVTTGTASVFENAANGTRVSDAIGVLDVDTGDTHTFSLTDNAGGRFQINATTGVITVADSSLLNYEAAASHNVTVRTTDSSGSTYDEILTINLIDVNDAPALSANPLNPTYTEGASAVGLFNFVSPNTFDSGQTIEELVFTVTNITDGSPQGSNERINLDGSTFVLTDLASGTTANNGYGYSVSLSGTTATVTLTTSGATTADISNLVISLSYINSSENPSTADRVFTITSIKDSGGTANGGIDTSSPNLISTVMVVAVNDAPVINTGAPVTYTENAPPILLAPGITLSDVDSASYAGGMLEIKKIGVSSALDILSIRDQGTGVGQIGFSAGNVTYEGTSIGTLSTGGGTFIVSLNASATQAATQALMRNITFENTFEATTTTNRTLRFVLTEVDSTAASADQSLTIVLVNDTPVVSAPGSALNATEQVGLAIHGTGFSVTDVDALSGGMVATLSVGEGIINIVQGDSGVLVIGNGTGTVTLNGTRTQINNLLTASSTGAITYLNNLDAPSASTTFTVTVNDQGNTGTDPGLSGTATTEEGTNSVTINITAVNDAPVGVVASTFPAIDEDNFTSAGKLVSDFTTTTSDPDAGAVKGIAVIGADNSNGSWEYTLDGSNWFAIGTVSDTSARLLPSDANARVRFVPNPDYNGTAFPFSYVAWDQTSGTAGGLADASVRGGATAFSVSSATVSQTINPINDAPVTSNASASGNEDAASIAITLTGSDVEGTVDNFQLNGLPANGTLYLDAGLVTSVSTGIDYAATAEALTLYFVPDTNWNGVTSFLFTAKDDAGLLDATAATATITVSAVNDQPVRTAGSVNNLVVAEDSGQTTLGLGGLSYSTGGGTSESSQTLSFEITVIPDPNFFGKIFLADGTTQVSTGFYTLAQIQGMRFETVTDASGGPSFFSFVVRDSGGTVNGGTDSLTETMQINITPVNDAPTATNLNAAENYTEDAALNLIDIVVSDVDSANVTVTLTLSDFAAGTLSTGTSGLVTSTFAGGIWTASGAIADVNTLLAGVTFNPTLDYNSNFSIATSVDDGVAPAMTGAKAMTGTAVNDAPTATNLNAAESYTEDTLLNLIDIVVSDVDSANVTVTLTLSDIAAGSLSTGTSGAVTSSFAGGVWTASGAIADVNALLAGVTFNPTLDYNSNFSIATSVNDGVAPAVTGAKAMTGTAVNDAPTVNATASDTGTEDTDVVYTHAQILTLIGATDVDDLDSALSVAITNVTNGSLIMTGGSGGLGTTFTFTPTLNFVGNLTFDYQVSDDEAPAPATSIIGTATVAIAAANDAPTATNLNAAESYTEDTALNLTDIVVSDVDSANVTVTLTLSDIAAGSLSTGTAGAVTSTFAAGVWSASGAIADVNALLAGVTFNPTLNYNNNFSIATSVDDGMAPAVTGAKAMTGIAVNDAPTVNATASDSGTEDTDVVYTHAQMLTLIGATDVDDLDSALSVAITNVTNGSLVMTGGTGGLGTTFTFTPTLNFVGNLTFDYQVSDDEAPAPATSIIGTATVAIAAANDAPTATNLNTPESYTEDTALNLTDIVVSDVDSANVTVTLTLSDIAAGSLSTGTAGAVTSTFAAGVWSASGAIADVNTLLAGVAFNPTLDYNSNFSIVTSVDDGVAPAVTGAKTMTGTAVNDAPTATNLNSAESYTEDTALNLTNIVVSDVDSSNVTVTLTLSDVAAGTLSTGTSGAVTSTFAGGVWSASGAIADVNTLLAGVTFNPALDYNSNFSIATSVDDGVAPAVTGAKAMTGTAVNDAPTATNLNATESYTEDTLLNLIDIVVSDVDSTNVTVTLTLSDIAAGSLSTGTSGAVTSTFAGGVWTASGAIADVNTLLAGVTFNPTLDYNSNFSIATSVDDGVAPAVTGTKAMTGTAVNDAPTVNATASDTGTEDTDVVYTHAQMLTLIGAADVDDANAALSVSITNVVNGSLVMTGGSGGVGTTFTFTPTLNFVGNMTFDYQVSDDEAPTPATSIIGTATVALSAANDAPTATNLNTAESYTEDTTLNLIDIVVSDVDSSNVTVTLTLSDVAAGTLSTGTSGAVTSTFAGGIWTASGAIADVNALLAGVTFNPTLNYNNNFSIATSVDDGVASAVTGAKAMTGTAVNDTPTATNLNTAESYTEDTALNLTNIVVSDVDSANVTVTLTLSDIAAGSLSTGTSGAVTSTFAGGVWSASGAIADVNTLLAGVTFNPALNYNSNFSIATSVDDGVAPAVTGAKAMTGTAVNDAPTATNLNVPESYTEDTALNLTNIVVSDVDSSNVTVTLTLSDITAGSLSTGTSGAVTSTFAGGVWIASGAIADVNTLLAGVTFNPTLDYNSNFSIATSVDDGVAPAVTGAKAMTGTAVNDAPMVNATASDSGTEDTDVVYTHAQMLTLIGAADVDDANAALSVAITNVNNGTLVMTGGTGGVGTTFTFTPTLNFVGNLTFDYQVSDDEAPAPATSIIGTATVAIAAANDAPTATNLNTPESYTEDTALNLTDIVVSDVDSANVTVTLTLSDIAAGSLSTGTAGAVTSTFAAGVWSASGAIADVNTLLAGVAFNPTLDYNSNFSIATSVDDGIAPAVTGAKAMTGIAVNDAPSGTDNTLVILEDTAYTFTNSDFGFTDTIENNTLQAVQITTLPAAGSLTLNGITVSSGQYILASDIVAGNLVFTPEINANGLAYTSFTFQVQDNGGTANGGIDIDPVANTIRFDVTAVNDGPIAVDDRTALDFDGVDDYVQVANDPSLIMSNTMTMEAWIKPDSTVNTEYQILNKEGEYEVAIVNGTIQWAFDNTDPDWAWHDTGYAPVTGDWTHIGISYNNGVVSTYANGILVDSYNGSGSIGDQYPALNELTIGGRTNNPVGKYFDGQIDEVRIWNTVRTQSEIASSLNQTLSGNEPGLAGYWKFDAGNGNSVTDSSAQSNTGQLGNGNASQAPAWTGQFTNEDTVLSVGGGAATGILLNDTDVDGDMLTVSLVSGPSNAASFSLLADGSFSYTPSADFNGMDSFTYAIADGNGGTDSATVYLNILPVNDAPTISAPASDSMTTGTTYTFSVLNGNALTVADVDDPNAVVEVTLNTSNGDLTLSTVSGLTFTVGDGMNNATMIFSGTFADINTALDGLQLNPGNSFQGNVNLAISVNDLGNTGGPALNATRVVAITVDSVTNTTSSPPTPETTPPGEDGKPIDTNPVDPTASEPIPEQQLNLTPNTDTRGRTRAVVQEAAPVNVGTYNPDDQFFEVLAEKLQEIPADILETVINKIDIPKTMLPIASNFALWNAIDAMLDELDDHYAESQTQDMIMANVVRGATWSLSAGFVAWILRGGSLIAAAMSSIPIWKGLDPLPIIALSKRERKRREEESQVDKEEEDSLQQEIGELIDGAKLASRPQARDSDG